MNHALYSPLKCIQGAAIQDRTSGAFSPRPVRTPGRSLPPPQRNSEWLSVPRESLYPKHNDFVLQCILLPSKPVYRPNTRSTPPFQQRGRQSSVVNYNEKWRRVIISRQLLLDGHITFVVGTKFGGIVTRDPKEVPLSKILDHVTPAELQRYENQEYLLEDLREENLPPSKPRGRPRKLLGASAATSRAQSTIPQARIHGNRHLGRPRKIAVVVPVFSPKPQQAAIRSRPVSTLQRVSIPVPSVSKSRSVAIGPTFNGPQPGHIRNITVPEPLSSEDELRAHKQTRRPQYSMVAASGLAPSETSQDEETSAEEVASRPESHDPLSLKEEPLAKRRKHIFDHPCHTSPLLQNHPLNRNLDGAIIRPESSAHESDDEKNDSNIENIDPVDTIEVRDEEAGREALLRQFQTSNIPQSNPSPTPLNHVTPIHPVPDPSPKYVFTTENTTVDNPDKMNNLPRAIQPTTTPTIEVTTPSKRTHKTTSLTPHFPHSARFAYNIPEASSNTKDIAIRSPSKSASNRMTAPNLNSIRVSEQLQSFQRNSKAPEPPTASSTNDKRALATPSPISSVPPNPFNSNKLSRLKSTRLQGLEPTSDITKYFRPKTTPTKTAVPAPFGTDSESEDPLTRASSTSSSSSDSLGSRNIVAHRHSPANSPVRHVIPDENEEDSVHSQPPPTIQRRDPQRPAASRTTIDLSSSEVPDSEDEDAHIRRQAEAINRGTGPTRSAVRPSQIFQRGVEAEEIEDDSDESSGRHSDVMVIERPGA